MQQDFFPREVITNVPRVTMTGHERLQIEQHRGLIEYAPDCIVLRTSCGLMRIAGADMRFGLYTAAEALITGRIDSVSFQTEEVRV